MRGLMKIPKFVIKAFCVINFFILIIGFYGVAGAQDQQTVKRLQQQSNVMESPIPGGKPKPGPSPQTNAGSTMGRDSLL